MIESTKNQNEDERDGGSQINESAEGRSDPRCVRSDMSEDDGADRVENPDPLFDAKRTAAYLGLVGVVKHPAQSVRAMFRTMKLRSTVVAGKKMARRSWLEGYISRNTREVPTMDPEGRLRKRSRAGYGGAPETGRA